MCLSPALIALQGFADLFQEPKGQYRQGEIRIDALLPAGGAKKTGHQDRCQPRVGVWFEAAVIEGRLARLLLQMSVDVQGLLPEAGAMGLPSKASGAQDPVLPFQEQHAHGAF